MKQLRDLLNDAQNSTEMAYLFAKKRGLNTHEKRDEVREWIDMARNELNRAEDQLDAIEENR